MKNPHVRCLLLIVFFLFAFSCEATNSTYKKIKFPLPSHTEKRSSVFASEAGYLWEVSVGCGLIPSEVDRIVTAFFQSAEYTRTLSSASEILSNSVAIPCYVTEMTLNVARTFVYLQCTSTNLVNVSRLESFLRDGDILPLECRRRITVAKSEVIR